MSELWQQVKRFADGDSLDADTLNIPVGQLASRTDYLKRRLAALMDGDRLSTVVLMGVRQDRSDPPQPGNVVRICQARADAALTAVKAQATMSMHDDFTASDDAFAVGIVKHAASDLCDVVVYGSFDFSANANAASVSSVIESGEDFRPGRYYLSANEAGRLTAHPNGPLIHVCMIGGVSSNGKLTGKAIVNPQFLDIGTSHVHRTAVLMARPAGTFSARGYLPLDAIGKSAKEESNYIALRFGGTWTADRKVDYSFYFTEWSESWSNGINLHYQEGSGPEKTVVIPAPDVEVPVSNGLTVRVSLPDANETNAYNYADDMTARNAAAQANAKLAWAPLTFPDAGKGWTQHDQPSVTVDLGNKVRAVVRTSLEHVKFLLSVNETTQFSASGVTVSIRKYTPSGVLADSAIAINAKPYTWCKADGDNEFEVLLYKTADASENVEVVQETYDGFEVGNEAKDAVYDYNVGMDAAVSNYWPPVPPKSAALMVNGVEMDNAALVPNNPTVAFGRHTIHWFEDAEGRKPWPEALVARDAKIDPSEDKVEILHWVRGFQGATGPVTSIQPKPGSPLKIYGYGTFSAANTGDLEIDAAVDFTIEDGGAPGYMVPKRSENGKLIAGPVVERLIAGPGINLTSSSAAGTGQGTVVVSLDAGAYINSFSDIALENAEQAKIGMFPYIRLRGYSGYAIASPSAFTATMRVPTNLPDGNYALAVSASVFGENGFSGAKQAACVSLSYSVLPDYSASDGLMYRSLKSSLMTPSAARMCEIPFGHIADGVVVYNGFDPVVAATSGFGRADEDDVFSSVFGALIPNALEFVAQRELTSEQIVLRPGYLVGIRIARAVASSSEYAAYTGPIGFINLSWSLVAAGS